MTALPGVAQLVECPPAKRMGTGLIPGQDTCLGCGFDPLLGVHTRGNQLKFVSHTHRYALSPFLLLALKITKFFKK